MIQGKKVRFRAIEEKDLEYMVEWINDPDISNLVVGWTFPISMAEQREWFIKSLNDQNNQRWIVETFDGQPIGLTGLWEIDFHNRHALTALKIGSKNIWGKGYGADAIMALMTYAFFQVGLNRLWGEILPFNEGSYRAYVVKCGWKVEGILRQHIFRNGKFYDLIRVAILKDEFCAHPQAINYIPQVEKNSISIKPEHISFDLSSLQESLRK